MSTTAQKPATTPIPVQLSAPECEACIFPHLSMPKRGPKCKLDSHRVFNLILWVLYTGMQWKCLPVPQDAQGKPALHDTTVDKVCARWADDGAGSGRQWPHRCQMPSEKRPRPRRASSYHRYGRRGLPASPLASGHRSHQPRPWLGAGRPA